jgi:branched-chain amino acid transport system ATP-binding protein
VVSVAVLEVRGISKLFGHLAALDQINIIFAEGAVTGVAGPNGSGKTTLFNVISGFYLPTKGDVFLDGRRITKLRPDQRARLGVIRTFQSNVLYRDATVFETLIRASYLESKTNSVQAFFSTKAYRNEEKRIRGIAAQAIEEWGFVEVADTIATDLPHGDQRRLGLAVASMMKPKILLIDEPIGGMSGGERAAVVEHIRQLNRQGITIVLVEHHVQTLLSVCDRLVALDFGHQIADGKPQDVVNEPQVVQAYLGTERVN